MDISTLAIVRLWDSTSCRQKCHRVNVIWDLMIQIHWNKTFNISKTSRKTLVSWVMNLGRSLMQVIISINFINSLFNWLSKEMHLCVLRVSSKWEKIEIKVFHLNSEIGLLKKIWDFSKKWDWAFTLRDRFH